MLDGHSPILRSLRVKAPDFATQRERSGFYIVAHSFTKFLAQSIGKRKLIRVHRQNDVRALARISGVPIEEWEQRWRRSLAKAARTRPLPAANDPQRRNRLMTYLSTANSQRSSRLRG